MSDRAKAGRPELLAAVKRLLDRVPAEPAPVRALPEWHDSGKKTPPDSLY